MDKGWPEHSPRSTAERHFASESVQSLPPVRVCTPPARGEGAVPRATYTSSSSEVSLERTPRAHAQHVPGRGAAQRPLQHWHSSPAGNDPGHLRLTGIDGQHAQVLGVPAIMCLARWTFALPSSLLAPLN